MAKTEAGRCSATLRWQPARNKKFSRWVLYLKFSEIAAVGLHINDKIALSVENKGKSIVLVQGHGRSLVRKPDGGNPNVLVCKVKSVPVVTRIKGFVVRKEANLLQFDLPKDADLGALVSMRSREQLRSSSSDTTMAVLRAQIEGMIASGQRALEAIDAQYEVDEDEDDDDENDSDEEDNDEEE